MVQSTHEQHLTVRDLIKQLRTANPKALVFVEREGEFRAVKDDDVQVKEKSALYGVQDEVPNGTALDDTDAYTGPSVVFTSWS